MTPTIESKHNKILLITPHYAPDMGPSAPILTALCEDLGQLGWEMTVVTAFPHYANALELNHSKHKLIEEETRNGVRVIRTQVFCLPKDAMWKRVIYQASYNLFATLAALRVGKPDLILGHAPFLWDGIPLLIKSILPRTPYIYIVYDIFPDVLLQLGILTNPKLIHLFDCVERFFYRHSWKVSVLSEGFRQNLVDKGVRPEKLVEIPTCVDVDFIHPEPRHNSLCKKWGLDEKFVVLYAGNIGLSQGLEIVLDAADLLRDERKIVFLLVGEGAAKAELQEKARAMRLENVRFETFQPRDQVPLVYGCADVCLVSLKKNIIVESVPSKTFTIMASGKAIIATVDAASEVGVLLERAECGICSTPEDSVHLAEIVRNLYHNQGVCLEYGNRGRQYVTEHYSRQVASEKYHQLFLEAISNKK
ncbi:MAG: glycosyltransferase family 4 protein [Anaerolineaceae bacterium]|nr:glycosyltransferase family 4 protein [Anaerolineaceae bacterium]